VVDEGEAVVIGDVSLFVGVCGEVVVEERKGGEEGEEEILGGGGDDEVTGLPQMHSALLPQQVEALDAIAVVCLKGC
jgi:hypothetical protein